MKNFFFLLRITLRFDKGNALFENGSLIEKLVENFVRNILITRYVYIRAEVFSTVFRFRPLSCQWRREIGKNSKP